ncbi:MAG TPA: type II secretion system protein M [Gallionellaceae bacterium]
MSLKTRLHEWKKTSWDSRPARERRILAAGMAVLAPVVVYFLLWLPAHDGIARLEKRLPLMRLQAAQMQRQAAEVDVLRLQAQPAVLNPTAMKSVLENSAATFQLRGAIESLEGMEPNGVRITFAAVPYARWLQWMRSLQRDQHIRVESLSVVALQTEGMVKISATLVNGVAR